MLDDASYAFQENKNQTDPPQEPGGGSDIQFSWDGKQMYAAFKGTGLPNPDISGAVLAFNIDGKSIDYVGSYTPQATATGSPKEFSLTVSPGALPWPKIQH